MDKINKKWPLPSWTQSNDLMSPWCLAADAFFISCCGVKPEWFAVGHESGQANPQISETHPYSPPETHKTSTQNEFPRSLWNVRFKRFSFGWWPFTKHQPTLTKSEIQDRRLKMKMEVSLVGVPLTRAFDKRHNSEGLWVLLGGFLESV